MIEKRLVTQLGERYTHASLIELRPNSYLISQHVRLPVFGQSAALVERTKESVTNKGYLEMKDKEFYTAQNSNLYGNPYFGMHATAHKYVLDPVATLVLS